jgi:predicted DNA-binding protein (UPF0251 family)/predicted Fe-Mo cluster-binding NifX family protein
MPRPPKQRIVNTEPPVTVYKPSGIRTHDLRWTTVTLDEFEAIRLVDREGLDQEAAASRMGVSRPTVTRILASARSKIAQVLVGGQALLIEGGPVVPGAPGRRGGGGRHGRGHGGGQGGHGPRPGNIRGRQAGPGGAERLRKENAMKVAVTSQGPDVDSTVDPRFGRAKYIIIVNPETGEFAAHDNTENIDAARGAGTQTGRNVVASGATAVISGRVGPQAFETLRAGNVAVYTGATGSVRDAIEQFNAGRLRRADEPIDNRRRARGRAR